MITIKTFVLGDYMTNCYLLTNKQTNLSAVIDPGYESSVLLKTIKEISNGKLQYILLTHGHFDHIGFAKVLQKETGAKLVIGEKEADFLSDPAKNLSAVPGRVKIENLTADILLSESQNIMLGNSEITFIETPGHTVGGGCYITQEHLFSGDTLMKDSMGRTDLPTGSIQQMAASLKKLYSFEKNYSVYPGHGAPTTLNYEKRYNPYLKAAYYENLY